MESALESGASIDAVDGDRKSALRLACEGGHHKIVVCLMAAGASIDSVAELERECDADSNNAAYQAVFLSHV